MSFVQGVSRSDFDSDQMRAFAVVRALEIIGEAANHLSDELQAAVPQVEWSAIIWNADHSCPPLIRRRSRCSVGSSHPGRTPAYWRTEAVT
ncbi:MAG: DUF86 domain-containing protein [Anaerolineae bacterium]|nr:DUF86 domain-containing protein [Anaerolineae bacterium]